MSPAIQHFRTGQGEDAPLLHRHSPLTDGANPDVFRVHGDERDEAKLKPRPALCPHDGHCFQQIMNGAV